MDRHLSAFACSLWGAGGAFVICLAVIGIREANDLEQFVSTYILILLLGLNLGALFGYFYEFGRAPTPLPLFDIFLVSFLVCSGICLVTLPNMLSSVNPDGENFDYYWDHEQMKTRPLVYFIGGLGGALLIAFSVATVRARSRRQLRNEAELVRRQHEEEQRRAEQVKNEERQRAQFAEQEKQKVKIRQETENLRVRDQLVTQFTSTVNAFPCNLLNEARFFELVKPRCGVYRLASVPDTGSFETPEAVLSQLPICSSKPSCWNPLSKRFDGLEFEAAAFLSSRGQDSPIDFICLEFDVQLTDRMLKEWKDSWRFAANRINECESDRQRQYWEELSDICRNVFGQVAAEHQWLKKLITEYRRSASENKLVTVAELAEHFPLELPTLHLEAAFKESPRERAIAEARENITKKIIAEAKEFTSIPTDDEIAESVEAEFKHWLAKNEHTLPR